MVGDVESWIGYVAAKEVVDTPELPPEDEMVMGDEPMTVKAEHEVEPEHEAEVVATLWIGF